MSLTKASYSMISGSAINVLDYGATGDGGSDDFQAIQDAIDNANSVSDTVIIPAGRYLISQPIQLKSRNLVLQGGVIGALSSFASATMDDGRTSAALIYLNGKGGSVTGSFNTSFYDLDASSPDNVARADHCIEAQSADNFIVQHLLVRRGIVSNIRVSGLGFANVFKEIYNAFSPYGWDYDVLNPAGGTTGNAVFENCYSVQCATGFRIWGVFSCAMSACAADQCDVGFELRSNARVVLNGCNTEYTISPFIVNGAYIDVSSWLINHYGTAATAISASTYSGQTGAPVSTTGVYAIRLLSGASMKTSGMLFGGGTLNSVEYVLKIDDTNSQFSEIDNWANYATNPKQNIIQYAESVGGASFAVSIASNNTKVQDLRRFYTRHSTYQPSYLGESGDFTALSFQPGGANGSTVSLELGNRASNGDASFIKLKSDTENPGYAAAVVYTRNNYVTQESLRVASEGTILPGTNNAQDIGEAGLRWREIFATNGTINTSDAREKEQDRPLSDAERAVAIKVKALLKTFKWKAAVAEKGDSARIHFGVYAQEVAAAFESEGLDPHAYGLFCYDEWDDEFVPEFEEVKSYIDNEDGTKTEVVEQKPTGNMIQTRVAGNSYGVRYNELFAFLIAAL